MLLSKQGNSNSGERIYLMEKMLKHIPKSHIHVVVADREFIGKEWFRWLDTQQIPFVIRIKENALVSYRGKEIPVRKLFENLNIHQQMSLCKPRRVYGLPVYLSAVKLNDQYLILASNQHQHGQTAFFAYKERWGIEVLFANLKSRGFNLEETHLTHENRIEKTHRAFSHCLRLGTSDRRVDRPYISFENQKPRTTGKEYLPIWIRLFAVCPAQYKPTIQAVPHKHPITQ